MDTNSNNHKEKLNFEESFSRLEEILDKMNSGETSLDESLKLYEEADKLIISCSTRLNDAERKIEILVKDRNHKLSLDSDQQPKVQDYNPSSLSNAEPGNT